MGQIFENAGKDLGDAQTITVDGDYKLGGDDSIFRTLSFGVRFDNRGTTHRQPVTTPAPFLPAPKTLADMPAGMRWAQRWVL